MAKPRQKAIGSLSIYPEIIETFENAGFSVLSMRNVGHGTPNMLIGCPGINILVRVGVLDESRVLEEERCFDKAWFGPLAVITSKEDAQQLIQNLAGGDGETIH